MEALDTRIPGSRRALPRLQEPSARERLMPPVLRLARTGAADIRSGDPTFPGLPGETRAVPLLLTLLHQGTPALQREALQAPGNANRRRALQNRVLPTVMAVRSTNDAESQSPR